MCCIQTVCCGFQFALQIGTFNLLLQYVCHFVHLTVHYSLYSKVLYSTLRYSTVQYSTIQELQEVSSKQNSGALYRIQKTPSNSKENDTKAKKRGLG